MAHDLLPGENLIIKTHQHWIVLVKQLLIPVLLLIAIAAADLLLKPDAVSQSIKVFATLAVVAIALLWLIVVWVRWQSTAYTLTDQRIRIESGIFSRMSKIVPIDRIQDCTTRQPLIGRMLGYGLVEVDSAGDQGPEVLSHVPNPARWRDEVFVQGERRRGGGPAAAAQPNPSGV